MARGVAPMAVLVLGYGKFVRADGVYALIPLAGEERGDDRRTLVHVEGIERPLVASRSGNEARKCGRSLGATSTGTTSRPTGQLPGTRSSALVSMATRTPSSSFGTSSTR